MASLFHGRPMMRLLAAGTGLAAGAYAASVALTWIRFGGTPAPDAAELDAILDRFMPHYDVVERHRIHVAAPPAITLATAKDQDLMQSPIARSIFRARELALVSTREDRATPRGLM